MFQKNIFTGLFILILVLVPSAYAGRAELTTYFPIPYGQYTNLKSTDNTYFATSTGSVGIGIDQLTTPGLVVTKLEVAQNAAIKVGQAYLSSGGNMVNFATNEWYNGSAWTQTAAGVLLQLTGTSAVVYGQNGAHTAWATVTSTAGWAAGCTQALKQNIRPLTFTDYSLLREKFRATDLFSYNRKDTPMEPEVGFIAEHAPDLVLDKTKAQVPLIKGIGYLATILKAQENVLVPLEKDVQALKQEVFAFGVRQQQIEALQKDVAGLQEKLKGLKEKTGKVNG